MWAGTVCNYGITAQTWLTPAFCPGPATYTPFLSTNIYRRASAHQKPTAISLQYSDTKGDFLSGHLDIQQCWLHCRVSQPLVTCLWMEALTHDRRVSVSGLRETQDSLDKWEGETIQFRDVKISTWPTVFNGPKFSSTQTVRTTQMLKGSPSDN